MGKQRFRKKVAIGTAAAVICLVIISAVWGDTVSAAETGSGQEADNGLVAAGDDGFAVYEEDVSEFKSFLASRNFYSKEEQYRKVAVQLYLVAKEAERIGLDASLDGVSSEDEGEFSSLKYRLVLQKAYMDKLVKEYPLSDPVIESYYYTHPYLFVVEDPGASGEGEEGDADSGEKTDADMKLRPLDDEDVRNEIRMRIVGRKASDLLAGAFDRLREKYNVRFCSEGQGCD